MICIPILLIYKLLKRFPIILLVFYSTQMFCNVETELELEEKTESPEFLEYIFKSEYRFLYSDETKATNNKEIFSFCEFTPSISGGFILTTSHKLYVLYSQLLLDQMFLCFGRKRIQKSKKLVQTTKQDNHGKHKENYHRETNSYRSGVLCIYHSGGIDSTLLILKKC